MNLRMWARALRRIPRLDKQQWNALDLVARWLIAARAAVLVITLIPCLIAALLACRDHAFDGVLALWVTLGLLMAHATNNILNDLIDHMQGVDKGNYFRAQYGVQPLEHGLMSVRASLAYAAVTGGIAAAIGLYLFAIRGNLVLGLMAVGAFFVLFYTWPLKYIGLGEVAVLAVWGPLMTGGAYFVIAGSWSWQAAWLSLPYALGATTVLFGKHIDKLADDKGKHIRTLPVLLGERSARYAVLGMMVLQYVLVLVFVIAGMVSPVLLVVIFAARILPPIWRAYTSPRPAERPDFCPEDVWPLYYVAAAFLHSRNFGFFFLLGLAGDVVLRAAGVVG